MKIPPGSNQHFPPRPLHAAYLIVIKDDLPVLGPAVPRIVLRNVERSLLGRLLRGPIKRRHFVDSAGREEREYYVHLIATKSGCLTRLLPQFFSHPAFAQRHLTNIF